MEVVHRQNAAPSPTLPQGGGRTSRVPLSRMTMSNGAFIYLFGFAGAGKLTIAKEIVERWDSILVDNHYVNNVIFRLIDIDSSGAAGLSDEVWEHVIRVRQ